MFKFKQEINHNDIGGLAFALNRIALKNALVQLGVKQLSLTYHFDQGFYFLTEIVGDGNVMTENFPKIEVQRIFAHAPHGWDTVRANLHTALNDHFRWHLNTHGCRPEHEDKPYLGPVWWPVVEVIISVENFDVRYERKA